MQPYTFTIIIIIINFQYIFVQVQTTKMLIKRLLQNKVSCVSIIIHVSLISTMRLVCTHIYTLSLAIITHDKLITFLPYFTWHVFFVISGGNQIVIILGELIPS